MQDDGRGHTLQECARVPLWLTMDDLDSCYNDPASYDRLHELVDAATLYEEIEEALALDRGLPNEDDPLVRDLVTASLSELTNEERLIIECVVVRGLTFDQTAKEMGKRTAKWALGAHEKAMEKLRYILFKRLPANSPEWERLKKLLPFRDALPSAQTPVDVEATRAYNLTRKDEALLEKALGEMAVLAVVKLRGNPQKRKSLPALLRSITLHRIEQIFPLLSPAEKMGLYRQLVLKHMSANEPNEGWEKISREIGRLVNKTSE